MVDSEKSLPQSRWPGNGGPVAMRGVKRCKLTILRRPPCKQDACWIF